MSPETVKNLDLSDTAALTEYTELLAEEVEMAEKFDAIEDDYEMNDAELNYYLEVQTRCTTKLLEASADTQ